MNGGGGLGLKAAGVTSVCVIKKVITASRLAARPALSANQAKARGLQVLGMTRDLGRR
jgi:hypothetical protein